MLVLEVEYVEYIFNPIKAILYMEHNMFKYHCSRGAVLPSSPRVPTYFAFGEPAIT